MENCLKTRSQLWEWGKKQNLKTWPTWMRKEPNDDVIEIDEKKKPTLVRISHMGLGHSNWEDGDQWKKEGYVHFLASIQASTLMVVLCHDLLASYINCEHMVPEHDFGLESAQRNSFFIRCFRYK